MKSLIAKLGIGGVLAAASLAAFLAVSPADLNVVDETTSTEGVPVEISLKDELRKVPNAKHRGTIKGAVIAKMGSIPRTDIGDVELQIVTMNAIEGGVEVFARAWDASGDQICFGQDGTVDIERFRIINPPVMVPDGTTSLATTSDGKAFQRDNFKEDPKEALLLSIEQTIKVKHEKFGCEDIIVGKVGNTTSTFYPAAGAASPVDGTILYNDNAGVAWATVHDAVTGTAADVNFDMDPSIRSDETSNEWEKIIRAAVLFDTSAIPDTDSISSSTLSLKESAGGVIDNYNQAVGIVGSTPAANNNLVTADYDQFGTSRYASDIDLGSISASNYNAFALNATGISAISKTGVSKFGVRLSSDIDNSTPTWASATAATFQFAAADTTGTTSDPQLVVEHSVPGPSASRRIIVTP